MFNLHNLWMKFLPPQKGKNNFEKVLQTTLLYMKCLKETEILISLFYMFRVSRDNLYILIVFTVADINP